MNIPESLTGQGFGSRSFNKNNADLSNNNPNTEIYHCQSLNGREDDSRSVTIASIALDVNNDGGRPMSRILLNGSCRFMENNLILCMTFANVYTAANHPDYRFTKSTRDGGTMPTNTKAKPLILFFVFKAAKG